MSLLRKHSAVLLGLALGLTAVCCGGGLPPAEREAAALRALDDEDYQAALELYQGLLDRQSEEGVPEDMRFRASLESIKCRANLKQYDESVHAFIDLEKNFAAEMEKRDGFRHALDVIRILIRQNAPIRPILELLEYAGDQWPERRARLERLAKNLNQRACIPRACISMGEAEEPGEPRLIDILDKPWEWERIDGK
jgi:hypothetical protein